LCFSYRFDSNYYWRKNCCWKHDNNSSIYVLKNLFIFRFAKHELTTITREI
jgi:hypothetical protein